MCTGGIDVLYGGFQGVLAMRSFTSLVRKETLGLIGGLCWIRALGLDQLIRPSLCRLDRTGCSKLGPTDQHP